MELRTDWSKLEIVRLESVPWVDSPMPGVQRRMLDRIGGEVAVATSVVRYAPGSRFSPHTHDQGEEFLVLDGVFSDEHGDWPAGAYVRNPPGSSHTPSSEPGCTIFVKLRQMPDGDEPVRVRCALEERGQVLLHHDPERGVRVSTRHLAPGFRLALVDAEVLVLDGTAVVAGRRITGRTWIRVPVDQTVELRCVTDVWLWLKEGHVGRDRAGEPWPSTGASSTS